ncbi:hypothetical protein ES703_01623 [subsurface metagenome]
MGFNVANVVKDNFSFGPGVLYAGADCGICPPASMDIGAVRSGAELTVTREQIIVEQGSPYQMIAKYVVRETVVLTVTGIEWNFDNLQKALGAGVVTAPGGDKRFRFGGDMGVCSIPIAFRHHTAEGDEIWIKLWCAQGNGEITVTFGDDIHEFPYGFTAVQGTKRESATGLDAHTCLRAWEDDIHDPDGILGDKEHLFEIYRETNPEVVDPCA